MKNSRIRFLLTALALMSFSIFTPLTNAAPIRFNQVVQVVNIKSGKASTSSYSQLQLRDEPAVFTNGDDTTPQDDRVIKETKAEIVEDACECVEAVIIRPGFPRWPLLGLAAIPAALVVAFSQDKTPTPTPTTTVTPKFTPTTPTPTPTTPTPTPTTPTPTPTTPPPSPTPPEPIPEPMTILLFGTGLAGIGLAARRKFGKKNDKQSEE
jgi:hypothetical protein